MGVLITVTAVGIAWLGASSSFSKKPGNIPALSDALSEREFDGVSNAEAGALVADAETLDYMEQAWNAASSPPQADPEPPLPYPEDVRLKGEVPDGARC